MRRRRVKPRIDAHHVFDSTSLAFFFTDSVQPTYAFFISLEEVPVTFSEFYLCIFIPPSTSLDRKSVV